MKNSIKEFKEFITTGNLIALAIGLLMGVEIGKVVAAFNSYLFTPIFAMIGGKPSFDDVAIVTINNAQFKFGAFFTSLFNFVIVAAIAFLVIKLTTKLLPVKKEVASGPTEIELLIEIRDSLKK